MAGILLVYDNTCKVTTGASCSWTVPSATYNVVFEIWGGGGGGGNPGTNCNCCSRGGPGSGGGYSKVSIATTPGTVYTVCAGAAGVSSQGWGSYCGICCNGCPGGTSYVTGTGLSNFCATGGAGGLSDFNTNCYAHCGCNFYSQTPGCGYGGDIVARGTWGVIGKYGSSDSPSIDVHGGAAGGPGGGVGGVVLGGGACNSHGCARDSDVYGGHGRIPGGGGAGSGCYSGCVCTPWASGRGAPGVVKIYY